MKVKKLAIVIATAMLMASATHAQLYPQEMHPFKYEIKNAQGTCKRVESGVAECPRGIRNVIVTVTRLVPHPEGLPTPKQMQEKAYAWAIKNYMGYGDSLETVLQSTGFVALAMRTILDDYIDVDLAYDYTRYYRDGYVGNLCYYFSNCMWKDVTRVGGLPPDVRVPAPRPEPEPEPVPESELPPYWDHSNNRIASESVRRFLLNLCNNGDQKACYASPIRASLLAECQLVDLIPRDICKRYLGYGGNYPH